MKILIMLLFISCSGLKIYDIKENSFSYQGLAGKTKQEFLAISRNSINCQESFIEVSDFKYSKDSDQGIFSYRCISFEDHCNEAHGPSCHILAIKALEQGRDIAMPWFHKGCSSGHAPSCYFLSIYTQNLLQKKKILDAACSLGHDMACHEADSLSFNTFETTSF